MVRRMTDSSIEWAVDYDGGIANVTPDRAEAEEAVQWIRSGRLVYRIVERTEWLYLAEKPVEGEPS
jgi:hypothetical protein